jgi:hypothetical protein
VRHYRLVGVSWLIAAFLPTCAGAVTVTVLGDTGPGNCTTTCSLRDAIATTTSGGTVDFAPGILPGTITLTQGELVIDKSLTIAGPGATQLAISANYVSRVLTVSAGTVSIDGVSLHNGTVSGGNGSSGSSVPSSAGGPGGGGIPAFGGCVMVAAAASLVLERVDIRNCVTKGGNGGKGGNGAGGFPAGFPGGAGGSGASGLGGGIYAAGPLALLDSSLINTVANGGDGGLGGDGGSAGGATGAGANGGNGGAADGGSIYMAAGGSLLTTNVTIVGSVVIAGRGGNGGVGGLATSGGNGGGGASAAGGLINVAASVTPADLEFSTLASGSVSAGLGGYGGSGHPNGVTGPSGTSQGNAIFATSTLTSLSSIVVIGVGSAPLCSGNVAAAAGSVNVDQDLTCTGFTLHGTFAQLFRPLDLATPWPAYMPVYKSVITDAAAACNDLTAQPVTSDQHGTPRPQGSQCDLGAIEADYIFVDGFE